MACSGGPDGISDGLVLALDAANKVSYPGSGTGWYNLSGTIQSGSLINGPTFNGGNGGSIVFDGVDDYVDISSAKLFATNKFSLGFWIKVTSFTGTYCSGAISNQLYTIFGTTSAYQTYTNTFSVGIQSSIDSNAVGTVQQSGFSINRWYYYFAVYDGTQSTNATKPFGISHLYPLVYLVYYCHYKSSLKLM
jgi:hypothetical protein